MKQTSYLIILLLLTTIFSFAQGSKKNVQKFSIKEADSLFSVGSWASAIPVYENVLKSNGENALAWNRLGFCYYNTGAHDKAVEAYMTSLQKNPAKALEATVRARLARIQSLRNQRDEAFASLDKAVAAGYVNLTELKSLNDFQNIRNDARFDKLLTTATNNAFPCMGNQQSREFDFWIGEWDVYPNGTTQLVGDSKIELASGGCMILENWTALGPFPNTGKSMNYVNTSTGKWEQLWIGSGGMNINNPQKFINGVYSDGAMRFDFEQSNQQGQKQIGRFIFFNQGPDQVRQFNEVSSDGGKTWTTSYDFIYKRRKR
jgi:tetratricopeptide (TPR) repeat protein